MVKNSFVYFISCDTWVKIGKADNVEKRLADLQVGNPIPLKLIGVIRFDSSKSASLAESAIHKALKSYRHIGEWFEAASVGKVQGMCYQIDYEPASDKKVFLDAFFAKRDKGKKAKRKRRNIGSGGHLRDGLQKERRRQVVLSRQNNSRAGVCRTRGNGGDVSASKRVKWDDFEDLPPQYDPIVVR